MHILHNPLRDNEGIGFYMDYYDRRCIIDAIQMDKNRKFISDTIDK